MKKKSILISMCVMAIAGFAQQKADLVVSYDFNNRSWENDNPQTTRMSLLANSGEAKFFNDISLWNDSLKSTPEGVEQLRQVIIATCVTQNPDGSITFDTEKGPVKKVNLYVFTSLADDNLRVYDEFGNEACYYDEALPEMQWEIGDSTANILGYDCVMASTDYHGRKWNAWFAPELPVPFGPWKFRGLPGLVLKAEADNGTTYVATGIEKTDRIITPMYSADTYERIDRKKGLAKHEYYLDNRESIMQAEHGGDIQFGYNPADRPKYDASKYAAEPDYKD